MGLWNEEYYANDNVSHSADNERVDIKNRSIERIVMEKALIILSINIIALAKMNLLLSDFRNLIIVIIITLKLSPC